MTLRFLRDDGVTPLDGIAFTGLEAGQLSDVVVFRAKAEGEELTNVLVLQRVESPLSPGTWLAEGLPPQDELWGRIRCVGEDNAAEPTWRAPRTDWMPFGAWSGLLLPSIPDGCAALLEWAQQPPSSAEIETYRWGLTALYREHARPVPPALTRVDRGVLSGIGDGASTFVLRGLEVSASAVPDAQVHVAAGLWAVRGRLLGDVGRSVTLDQTDGAAAALAAGESYLALVSRGVAAAAPTVTKGAKALAPVAPAPPADEKVIAEVRVEHQVGGTSVIEAADVTARPAAGRFAARAGAGLQVIVSPGEQLAAATWRYDAVGERQIGVADDDTSYIWITGDGLLDATQDAEPPSPTAQLIWEADAAGGAVVALRDRRRYVGGEVVITLRGVAPGAPGLVDDLLLEHTELVLEEVVFRLSDHAGASAGETIADLEVDGATIYTDHATDDRRPRLAWDAADLVDRAAVHQVTTLRRGSLLAFHLAALATGAAPARAELHLVCRRP